MSRYILDERGVPVLEPDLMTWADWMEKSDRKIARTEIGGVTVSTVFLGLDHSFGGPAPVLYETMTFGMPGCSHGHEARYFSRELALRGHAQAVSAVIAELLLPTPAASKVTAP